MRRILSLFTALLLFVGISHAQVVERTLEAIEDVATGVTFHYQSHDVPVLDITYHEFSADSLTWRKDFVEGDCYVRFANTIDLSGDQTNWWVFNFCTCNGAIPEIPEGGGVDTLFMYYYQSDTIYSIDTILVVDNNLNIKIPQPETITGNTTNFSDSNYHTHEVELYMGELENVDTTGVDNSYVLKWNSVTSKWEVAPDLIGGGGGALTVQELDGDPSVDNVIEINVDNGVVTDNGLGSVTIDFSLEPQNGAQDFYRSDTLTLVDGDQFITFDTPFPDADYVVVNAYAQYSNDERQNLAYDSLTVNGFKVLGVVGESLGSYMCIRNLDSLFLAISSQGLVFADGGDPTAGYLSNKTDDSTITVINNELHVFIPDTTGLYHTNRALLDAITTTDTTNWGTDMDATNELQTLSIDSTNRIFIIEIEDGNSISFETIDSTSMSSSHRVDTLVTGVYGDIDSLMSVVFGSPQTVTYSATPTQNWNNGKDATVTLTGDITTYTLSNVPDLGYGDIIVIQDGTGGYGIAAFAHSGLTVKYVADTAPTASEINSDPNGHSAVSYKRIGSYLYITYYGF